VPRNSITEIDDALIYTILRNKHLNIMLRLSSLLSLAIRLDLTFIRPITVNQLSIIFIIIRE